MKDKLSKCEDLLSKLTETERRNVVNAPYGKNNYTPLIRASWLGSTNMLKFLVASGADVTHQNKHEETLFDALDEGEQQQIAESALDSGVVVRTCSAMDRFVWVRWDKNDREEEIPRHNIVFPVSIEGKRLFKNDVVKIRSRERGKDIFIRDRFSACRDFLRKRSKRLDLQKTAGPVKRVKTRYIPRQVAARILQKWWKKRSVVQNYKTIM